MICFSSFSNAALSVSSPRSYDAGIAHSSNTSIQNIHTYVVYQWKLQSHEPSQSKMNQVMTVHVAYVFLANCNARNSVDIQKPCDNSGWLRPAKLPQHALEAAGPQTICQHFHKNTVICHLFSPWQHQVTLCWLMYRSICLVQPGCLVAKGTLWTLASPSLHHI